jgi:hypothetical protein
MCGEKCLWINTNGKEKGVCTSSEVGGDNVGCWVLSKSVCDRYLEETGYNIPGINVVDAPCFFNGRNDGLGYYCVAKSSLMGGNCEDIETNSIIIDSEGKEIESCNNAPTLFELSFTCSWLWNHNKNSYFCTTVYFLTENGLRYYFLLFFIITILIV